MTNAVRSAKGKREAARKGLVSGRAVPQGQFGRCPCKKCHLKQSLESIEKLRAISQDPTDPARKGVQLFLSFPASRVGNPGERCATCHRAE